MFKKLLLTSILLLSSNVIADTKVRSWCVPKSNSNTFTVNVVINRLMTPGTDYVSVFLYPENERQIANHYKIPNGTREYTLQFLDVSPSTWLHINNDDGNINKGPNNKQGPGTCLM